MKKVEIVQKKLETHKSSSDNADRNIFKDFDQKKSDNSAGSSHNKQTDTADSSNVNISKELIDDAFRKTDIGTSERSFQSSSSSHSEINQEITLNTDTSNHGDAYDTTRQLDECFSPITDMDFFLSDGAIPSQLFESYPKLKDDQTTLLSIQAKLQEIHSAEQTLTSQTEGLFKASMEDGAAIPDRIRSLETQLKTTQRELEHMKRTIQREGAKLTSIHPRIENYSRLRSELEKTPDSSSMELAPQYCEEEQKIKSTFEELQAQILSSTDISLRLSSQLELFESYPKLKDDQTTLLSAQAKLEGIHSAEQTLTSQTERLLSYASTGDGAAIPDKVRRLEHQLKSIQGAFEQMKSNIQREVARFTSMHPQMENYSRLRSELEKTPDSSSIELAPQYYEEEQKMKSTWEQLQKRAAQQLSAIDTSAQKVNTLLRAIGE